MIGKPVLKRVNMDKRIVIAGGGTGGHIFPAIAIANALKRQDPEIEILFVGAKGKMEMEKVPQAGYPIVGLDIAGFNRSSLIKNISLPLKIITSFIQVRRIIRSFRPHAVIGVGGYSSFPVLRYAQARRIPTFIHESNSFAGKANILLGKKATRVFVASEGMERFFPAGRITITGNPIRTVIAESTIIRDEALVFFGLDPKKVTVLVTGGSLGAKSINEAIARSLNAFSAHHLQLIWQTGKPFAETAQALAAGKTGIWTSAFIPQMEQAYAAADIVISRSGAMAISELCVAGKPVILVPYPFAAEDHQTVNAQRLVNHNAGLMVRDRAAGEQLVTVLLSLAADAGRREVLKRHISRLAVKDADRVIAAEILRTIKEEGQIGKKA